MTKHLTRSDAEVVAALRDIPDAARVIEELDWEIRQGDAAGRQRATSSLSDHATRREIAAVKRVLKG